ncbi:MULTISPECIES: hypothetical protein [unclassified Enterococcus]|jgi:hypothetical protein|uniref:hypothetical protein n=1 Tax=unclassified Enterococcus TaxID=2608891 RepID=UPI003D2D3FF9
MLKKLLISSLVLSGIAVAPTAVSAWTPGVPDPNTPIKNVEREDSADIEVSGWIGEWDDTDIEGPGPIDPEDPSNVNVTIPVRVFFANSVDEDGNPVPEIISPLYTISNNSQTHALSVSIDEFSLTNNVPIRQHLSIVPTREAGVTLQTRSDSFLNSRHFFTNVQSNTAKTFSFEGQIDRASFPALGTPALRPTYNLKFHFAAV